MPSPRAAKERHFIYYLALTALIVSLAGSFFNWLIARNYNHEIVAQRTLGRQLTVTTIDGLCSSIYNNIASTVADQQKNQTFAYYHKLLPSLSAQDIANLVAGQKVQLAGEAKRFDPKKCLLLPINKLIPKTITTKPNKNA